MLTIRKPLSESEAVKAQKPMPWRGWFRAEFRETADTETKRGDPMIAVWLAVFNGDEEREYRDWFTAADRGAARLRHAAEAVDVLAQYEAGQVSADLFAGHACEVKLDIEKRRGFPDRSVIVDYRAAAASGVVHLRSAG